MRILGRHYQTGEPIGLELEQGKIARVHSLADERPASDDLPWIAPGFVDLQINGFGGREFSTPDLTVEHVLHIVQLQAADGVTQFCPTVTTASFDTLSHALGVIAAACNQHPRAARRVLGIHLEGPYISREDGPRGAHPLEHCRPCDWQEFQRLQEAAQGRICLLTLSPEYDGAPEFIRQAVGGGVVVSIGHTAATSAQIKAAADAGASMSTHLGNGAHGMLRRHPNYLWDQLADDRLTAALIADGHHLPAETVKVFVRAKQPSRVLLVSDRSGYSGLPPGVYPTGLCKLEILADGRLVIAGQNQLLAGASQPIGVGVANLMRFAEIDLPTAIDTASAHPLQVLHRAPIRLTPENPADVMLFHLDQSEPDGRQSLRVSATYIAGELAYQAT